MHGLGGRGWTTAWLVVAGVALQAPGCWCDPTEPERFNPFPDPEPAHSVDYCAHWAPAHCQYLERCQPATHAGYEAAGGCSSVAQADCERDVAPDLAGESQGRVAYDGRYARGCIESERDRACGEAPSSACEAVFSGFVVGNQPCTSDSECATGLFCSGGPDTCGLCTQQSGPGGACWGASSCREGLRCTGGLCEEPAQAGDSCLADPNICPSGTFCFPPQTPFAVCTPMRLEGASCSPTAPCLPGLACLPGDGGTTCRGPVGLGEACDPTARVAPPCRFEGTLAFCERLQKVCQELAVVGDGEACGSSAVCLGTHRCTGGRCVERPTAGEACIVDATGDPCFESRCENNLCVTNARFGDGCDAGCRGLACVDGRCAAESCDGGVAWDAAVPVRDGG